MSPSPDQRRITRDRRTRICKLWSDGETIATIAADVCISQRQVRKIVVDDFGTSRRNPMTVSRLCEKVGYRSGGWNADKLTLDEAGHLMQQYPNMTLIDALLTDWRGHQ